MHEDEACGENNMNKPEFEAQIKSVKNIEYSFGYSEIRIADSRMVTLSTSIPKATSSNYTQANAELINTFFQDNKGLFKGWDQQCKAYLKTPESKARQIKEDAKQLAIKAGLHHDEHGGYGRGDYHTLSVVDIVSEKKELQKLNASGKLLALVKDGRKRVYSKKYMSSFGGGYREDFYLVGTNENGLPFVHGVSRNCATVSQAVNWIWGEHELFARHGDIALTDAKLTKPGERVTDAIIHDNHHFTGEIYKNGAMYVRNGMLHHVKDQHPDVIIGNEWKKVIIAKRAAVGGSHD